MTTELREEIAMLLPRLRHFGRALTRTREDADDLVQIALEKALTHSTQWQPGSSLRSWLFRIMQNAWIDELRARERQSQTLAVEDEVAQTGLVATSDLFEVLAVREALAHLSEDHLAIVTLVLIEGLAYHEAAQLLCVPVGTVTSRLARAREALHGLLEGSSYAQHSSRRPAPCKPSVPAEGGFFASTAAGSPCPKLHTKNGR